MKTNQQITAYIPAEDLKRAERLKAVCGLKKSDLMRLGFKKALEQFEAMYEVAA
jgi:hypothetical protein